MSLDKDLWQLNIAFIKIGEANWNYMLSQIPHIHIQTHTYWAFHVKCPYVEIENDWSGSNLG